MKRPLRLLLTTTVAVSVLSSCADQTYAAKPLNINKITATLTAKNPTDIAFQRFLAKNGVAENQLPLKSWGIHTLTLAALYFNPKLTLANAKWAASLAAVEVANQPALSTLDANIAHSNQGAGEPKPWSYGLTINLPVETTNKRQLRTEEARHLAEATRIEMSQTAWQLRHQISQDLITITESSHQVNLYEKELKYQNEIVAMIEKRVKLGLQSNTELSQAKLLQLKTLNSLNQHFAKMPELTAILAADVGLTIEKFNLIPLETIDTLNVINQQKSVLANPDITKKLQETALFNRLDVRASLARYAASESKIKLGLAKQTPDILFSPAFIFDFGNSIWSLGLSNLLFILNKNQTPTIEAEKLRDIEAAQFEVLQASIIAELARAEASYSATLAETAQAEQLVSAGRVHFQQLQKQFDAGNIDRLELTQSQLSRVFSAQTLHDARFKSIRAGLAIEDVMQYPLYDAPK